MKKRYHLLIIIGILLIGFVLGSFFDLQIDKVLWSENNPFGLIMASFGVYPCYAGLAFVGGGLMSTTLKRKELPLWGKFICFFLSGLAIVMAIYLCGGEWPSVNGYNVPQLEWLSFLIAGIVFAGVYCAGYLVCRKGDAKQLWAMLLVMVVIFTVSLLPAGFVIKLIIHRPRYRYLVRTGVLPFYNWWENCANYKDYIGGHIDGFPITKEDFKSFPSGHSGTGMIMAMFLSYAPIFFKKLKGKETIMFYVGVLWGLTMMFSRMLVGAHYLTDTCMGSLIVMVVFYIANEFAYKKGFFETKEEEVEPVAE